MFLVSYTSLFEENLSVSKFRNSDLSNKPFYTLVWRVGLVTIRGPFPYKRLYFAAIFIGQN